MLSLLSLAAVNPDGLIATYNIKQDRSIDLDYLANLSPDAVPALHHLPPAQRECVFGRMNRALHDDADDWRGWNLGRQRAREIIAVDLPDGWRCS